MHVKVSPYQALRNKLKNNQSKSNFYLLRSQRAFPNSPSFIIDKSFRCKIFFSILLQNLLLLRCKYIKASTITFIFKMSNLEKVTSHYVMGEGGIEFINLPIKQTLKSALAVHINH